jgi:hypothetical protein
VKAFCDLLKEWKPVGWAEEKTQITSGVGPYIERRQRERQAYCFRHQFPTRGDKASAINTRQDGSGGPLRPI